MIDSRGHGQSGGCYSGLGWLEWQDCTLWIDRIVGELGAGTPVILHGISMGANTLLNAAGEGLPNEVRAIIADSPFTSVRAIMTYRLHKHHIPAMPILISAALLNLTGERHQIFGADTRKQVARSRVPTLFIHSQADRQIHHGCRSSCTTARPGSVSSGSPATLHTACCSPPKRLPMQRAFSNSSSGLWLWVTDAFTSQSEPFINGMAPPVSSCGLQARPLLRRVLGLGLPGVDQFDPRLLEVLDVAGRQDGAEFPQMAAIRAAGTSMGRPACSAR